MNSCQKYFSACALALLTQAAFAQSAPNLGAASSFAVLSATIGMGGAVTCTDSAISGDVGSSGLAASITQTRCTISGSTVAPVSQAVLDGFNDAYASLNNLGPCDTAHTLTGTLAGVTLTSPGVYCVDSVAKTGTLTLSGPSNATWIFLVDGALTGTNFKVIADGTQACNVYWQADAAATLTTSQFIGTILAGEAITVTGGTFTGDVLATAAVTLTGASITGCVAGVQNPAPAKLKCNQGVGNGPESCDPGNSNQGNPFRSNDELGGVPGNPGRKGGNTK
jgi:hypothetical protein